NGVAGLKLVYPEATDKVPVFANDESVQFRWVAQDLSDDTSESENYKVSHQLQIASDPAFKNIVHSQRIAASAGSSIVSDQKGLFGSGEHYWRIVSQYESQHSRLTVRS